MLRITKQTGGILFIMIIMLHTYLVFYVINTATTNSSFIRTIPSHGAPATKDAFLTAVAGTTALSINNKKVITEKQKLSLIANLPFVMNKKVKMMLEGQISEIDEDFFVDTNKSISSDNNVRDHIQELREKTTKTTDYNNLKLVSFQKKENDKMEKTVSYHTPQSLLYWNLSCPLEMSMFAGSHMVDPTNNLNTTLSSNDDYWSRAIQSRDLVLNKQVLEQIQKSFPSPFIKEEEEGKSSSSSNKQRQQRRPTLIGRKVLFVGDSLMRQIFISFACLLWDHVESYTVVWYDEHRRRKSRTQHPNTMEFGPHSKFEEARIRFRFNYHGQKEGIEEVIYHHGIGRLLQLGTDYKSNEIQDNDWLKNAAVGKKHLSTTVPRLPRHLGYIERINTSPFSSVLKNSTTTMTKEENKEQLRKMEKAKTAQDAIELTVTESNVTREQLRLGPMDIVLVNGSVHGNVKRSQNLQTIQLFLNYIQANQLKNYYPTLAYVMTGVSHFSTDTGIYSSENNDNKKEECVATTSYHELQRDEISILRNKVPILGQSTLSLQLVSGNLHVGGKDCLHWMQPGIPDILAAQVIDFVSTLTS